MNARRADYNFGLVPVKLKLLRAMMGSNDLDKLFRFDEKDGTEIIVVPLNDPEQPVRFTVDSFWQWHFAGAYVSIRVSRAAYTARYSCLPIRVSTC